MSRDNNDEVEVGDVDWSHRRHTRNQDHPIQTAGIFSGVADFAGDAYDTVAGAADWAAGSTDEAVARTFDDEPGGGIIHGFMDAMPLMSQPDSVTQRQIEQGVIDAPEGWEGSSQQNQQQQDSRDFERSGTPTTDGQNEQNNQDQSGGGMGDEQMKTLAMVGGAVLAGGYALTKVSSGDKERSVPETNPTTRREVGNGARSNRGNSSEERERGRNGGV